MFKNVDVWGVSSLKHYRSLPIPPKGTSLRETASDEPSRVKIGSVVFAVSDDKKKRKGKESKVKERYKAVIFHVVVEKPPVNGV